MITTEIRNLISNAIKFTSSGQHITLSIKKQSEDKFREVTKA